MSNSNNEFNTDHSASNLGPKAQNPLFAGIDQNDNTQTLDPMSLHEQNLDHGEDLKKSSENEPNLTNFQVNSDETNISANIQNALYENSPLAGLNAKDFPEAESRNNTSVLVSDDTTNQNSTFDTTSQESIETPHSSFQNDHEWINTSQHISNETTEAREAQLSTYDQAINHKNMQEDTPAFATSRQIPPEKQLYPNTDHNFFAKQEVPKALRKNTDPNRNYATDVFDTQNNDLLSNRSLPSDPSPKLPQDMITRYEKDSAKEDEPLYYAPGEPLSGKPGEYFKKLKQNNTLKQNSTNKALAEKNTENFNSTVNNSLTTKSQGSKPRLADKNLFANVSINKLHTPASNGADQIAFGASSINSTTNSINSAPNLDADKKDHNLSNNKKTPQEHGKISIKSSILLYIRQFIASFFTHTNLGVIIPKTAGALGPCYPSSMPFPCFFTGFIATIPFFYFLDGVLPSNTLLWATLSTICFFILNGCSGFNGIVKVLSAFSNTRSDPSLNSCVCVLYIFLFVVCLKDLGALHGNGLNGALLIGATCMLASAVACSLEFGLTDDPVDSFGSLTLTGLCFVIVCALVVVLLIIPPLPAVSLCGIALLVRLLLGFYLEHRSIMISRAIVCGMYLNVLLILMLYLLVAQGRSLI